MQENFRHEKLASWTKNNLRPNIFYDVVRVTAVQTMRPATLKSLTLKVTHQGGAV